MKAYSKYLIVFIRFAITVFVFSSCNNRQGVIDDYASLVEEIEMEGGNFTEQDWENFTLRCEEVDEDMQKYTFNKEQQQKIRKLQGRMAAAVGKHSGTLLKNAAEEAMEQIKAFSEGFMEGVNGEDNK